MSRLGPEAEAQLIGRLEKQEMENGNGNGNGKWKWKWTRKMETDTEWAVEYESVVWCTVNGCSVQRGCPLVYGLNCINTIERTIGRFQHVMDTGVGFMYGRHPIQNPLRAQNDSYKREQYTGYQSWN